MTPFVLLGRKKLPPENAPSPEHIYDGDRQLWIDKTSGTPLVLCMHAYTQPSPYGETTMTETREGVDQTEGVTLRASQFGETTLTRTREGADQSEGAVLLRASQFGETINTRTREGVDQAEGTTLQASQFGETTLTDTREGADQTEGAAPLASHAPYSHF
jgi:hypothetical protein